MTSGKTDIWVYAHWKGMTEPKCMGILSAHQGKGRKSFSFEYDLDWIESEAQQLLDPDIGWYSGAQFPGEKDNFGIILDSMPDRWGRTLLKRRAAILAMDKGENAPKLYDIDYLLGVYDESRMGALRFKKEIEGPFLDIDKDLAVPPWAYIRELQYAATEIESDKESQEIKKWIRILLAPGSSLGGARPKANIQDEHGHLWIAKFPSKNDEIDKGAWEYLAYRLALQANITMAESKIEKVAGRYHTFITKRFDRDGKDRIHFASAMTMTGNNEDTIRDNPPSYLDLAEFVQFAGANQNTDLVQLWKRIVFNILISNTDDHLRNHGFLLTDKGWVLSPAYDLNPSIDKHGLSLNIDSDNNFLDLDLVSSVGEYFQLNGREMRSIMQEMIEVVSGWRTLAKEIGISRAEQELMAPAFYSK